MIDVYDLTKRFNHRWQTDPLFLKDFDYDQPKYANVPDDIKWMLPMHEAQKSGSSHLMVGDVLKAF